tara:strand:+ start:732 stop:1079 length:348 start_codon:yes stop_codon:yes gene_type:complete
MFVENNTMLLVNGNCSLDIFKALVRILKYKCFEFFGETMVFSRSTLGKDTEELKEFFHNLGIKLFIDLTDDMNHMKECNNYVLKDYKLWIKMPCRTNLSISFDYVCHNSNPGHLE